MQDVPDDTELEEQLRQAAARFEPVPPGLMRSAVGSYAWRTIDADLAELVFDSAVDDDEMALVRGAPQERMLSFRSSDLTIEVEVTGAGAQRRLVGQLVPPRQAAVEIRHGHDVTTCDADELGRFSAEALHAGPISLRCSVGAETGTRRVVTDWVSV